MRAPAHVRVELENGGKTLIQVSDDGTRHGQGRRRACARPPRDQQGPERGRSRRCRARSASAARRSPPSPPSPASRSSPPKATARRPSSASPAGGSTGWPRRPPAGHHRRGPRPLLQHPRPPKISPLRRRARLARPTRRVATLALAHPEVGFELARGRDVAGSRCPPGQELEERLAAVWGRELAGDAGAGELCRRRVSGRRVRAAPGRRAADRTAHPALRQRPAVQGSVPGARGRGRLPLRHPSRRPAVAASSASRSLPTTWT